MLKLGVIFLCLMVNETFAGTWRPPDRLLHAVRFVESSHGVFTVGDAGQSLGDFQISEAAWIDVNAWRKARSLPTYDYVMHVWSRKISRQYASDYLTILHGRLRKRLNRAPTAAELYAAYNMGMTTFGQCDYQITRINATTARKCRQIDEIMAGK